MYPKTELCQQNGYRAEEVESGLSVAAGVFMIIGTVFTAACTLLIGLAWCIPMCKYYFGRMRSGESVGRAFKICALIFVSPVAGILMLCDEDYNILKLGRRQHVAKTILAACFFVLATAAFIPTVALGSVTVWGLLAKMEGWGLLGYVVLYILFSAADVILSVVNFILGIILVRCTVGRQCTFGKVAVTFSIIYVALPLLYVLILYFV